MKGVDLILKKSAIAMDLMNRVSTPKTFITRNGVHIAPDAINDSNDS